MKYSMNSDIGQFAFVTYRIFPFILVSYFVMSTLLGNDFSGFLVFLGILFTSLITIGIGKNESVKNFIYDGETDSSKIITKLKTCNLIMLGNQPLSYLPLSTHTFAFALGYFSYIMKKTDTLQTNLLSFVFLLFLVIGDTIYNVKTCYGPATFIPLIIGGIGGILWAVSIGKKNWMVPKQSTNEKCSTKDMKYKCNITTSGQLIS